MALPGDVSWRLAGRVFGEGGRDGPDTKALGFGVAAYGKAVVTRKAFAAAHFC
jgi:hypothetical protein